MLTVSHHQLLGTAKHLPELRIFQRINKQLILLVLLVYHFKRKLNRTYMVIYRLGRNRENSPSTPLTGNDQVSPHG